MTNTNFTGEIAALSAALLWAISSAIYTRLGLKIPPLQLNLYKGLIAIASFGSTYLGIWLQQTSLKFAPTGIAQTFLATSPLFILPIVAFQGEKISLRAILGAVISLGGIALMFLR